MNLARLSEGTLDLAQAENSAYYYLVEWLGHIDPPRNNMRPIHVRTQSGRIVDTLDQVIRAILNGELAPDDKSNARRKHNLRP